MGLKHTHRRQLHNVALRNEIYVSQNSFIRKTYFFSSSVLQKLDTHTHRSTLCIFFKIGKVSLILSSTRVIYQILCCLPCASMAEREFIYDIYKNLSGTAHCLPFQTKKRHLYTLMATAALYCPFKLCIPY